IMLQLRRHVIQRDGRNGGSFRQGDHSHLSQRLSTCPVSRMLKKRAFKTPSRFMIACADGIDNNASRMAGGWRSIVLLITLIKKNDHDSRVNKGSFVIQWEHDF